MFKHLQDVDLQGYGLSLTNFGVKVDMAGNTEVDLNFTAPFMDTDEAKQENIERFLLDLRLINRLRTNCNPAVQQHYEELLILMSLTNREEKHGDK